MALGLPDHLRCETCSDDAKLVRRCPKPAQDPAWMAAQRAACDRPVDPSHPETCPRLWWERGEVSGWLLDHKAYKRGALKRTGGLEDQPARWLQAQRIIEATMDAVMAEDRDAEDRDVS